MSVAGKGMGLGVERRRELGTANSKHVEALFDDVNLIYCSITVNHRLTGPGKMVKLCLLFVGKFQIQKFD